MVSDTDDKHKINTVGDNRPEERRKGRTPTSNNIK